MIALLAAFQFLTILPPLVRRPFTGREMGRAVAFYPLVGLALGGLLYGAWWGLHHLLALPSTVTAALIIALWLLLTRALHLDGLMDSCDGLFGGWTPARRLEIMRDSRVGAFGVAGAILLLLIQFAALGEASRALPALLLALTLGRWALSLTLIVYPYGRVEGLGREMKDNARWPQAAVAAALTLAAAWFAAGVSGLLAAAGVTVVVLALGWFALRRIPDGLTGDIYGALCVLAETLTLLVFSV